MAIGSTQPFRASSGNVSIMATTASASVTLPTGGDSVIGYNASTSPAFVAFSTASPAAGSIPVPPGGQMLLGVSRLMTTAAVLPAGSDSGAVYFTRGSGDTY